MNDLDVIDFINYRDDQGRSSYGKQRFVRTETITELKDENIFNLGDIVTIKFKNGSSSKGCKITRITRTGFH